MTRGLPCAPSSSQHSSPVLLGWVAFWWEEVSWTENLPLRSLWDRNEQSLPGVLVGEILADHAINGLSFPRRPVSPSNSTALSLGNLPGACPVNYCLLKEGKRRRILQKSKVDFSLPRSRTCLSMGRTR